MITEDYCSYEVAKLLKEKGFDTFKSYGWDEQLFDKEHPRNFSIGFDNKEHWISCPTQSMAMKWLREVHHIHTEICLYITNPNDIEPKKSRLSPYYTFGVWNTINGNDIDKRLINDFIGNSYEEAVEAALKYSLENLI